MVARVVALPLHAVRSAWRAVSGWVARQLITGNRRVALLLAVVTVFIAVAAVHVSQSWFSPGLLILPVLAGGLLLWPRALRILFALIAIALAYDVVKDKAGPGLVLTIVVTALVVHVLARTREKLGMLGLRGETMLIELRDRIRAQGTLPELPEGWGSVSVLRPAGGSSFGGDFLVSSCDGKTLEVALVDVAGKGVDAGTRALLLSGAFGGLLGSVPQGEFLPTCNAYVRRGAANEGFVTAIHLALDLATGDFVVSSAGHPPAAHFERGQRHLAAHHGPRDRPRRGRRPAAGARAGHAAARRCPHALHRRPGGSAWQGHRRRHRPAARRGGPAGHDGVPGRRRRPRPGTERGHRHQRRPRAGSHLAHLTGGFSPTVLAGVISRTDCS